MQTLCADLQLQRLQAAAAELYSYVKDLAKLSTYQAAQFQVCMQCRGFGDQPHISQANSVWAEQSNNRMTQQKQQQRQHMRPAAGQQPQNAATEGQHIAAALA